ncbi:MAG: hypothetical protein E7627_04845 [Ruminococcaceae bacterium]|nr:hypothetical protein [Oscillospiraceae bacterium]
MHEQQKQLIRDIYADIKSGRKKKVIVDSDAYNEMDDQFAILYALCATDKMDVLAINAAPFVNDNAATFEEGMEKSWEEIKRLTACLPDGDDIPIYLGSRKSIEETGMPDCSPAAENIIKTAMASDEVIYILTMGCITNVASAILLEPRIKEKICVVWLGGNEFHKEDVREFNLEMDYAAGQVVLNSGCPLVLCPAQEVTVKLEYTLEQLTSLGYDKPHCAYLTELTKRFHRGAGAPDNWTWIMWDMAAPALLDDPNSAEIEIVTAPAFTDDFHYAFDKTRHDMIIMRKLYPEKVFENAFGKIKNGKMTL